MEANKWLPFLLFKKFEFFEFCCKFLVLATTTSLRQLAKPLSVLFCYFSFNLNSLLYAITISSTPPNPRPIISIGLCA
jgi:hypothetical protein